MTGGTAVFTIIAKNYLSYARVLMRSAAEHHPDWHRVAILVDRVDGYFDPGREDFEIIPSTDLPIPEVRWFHFKYSILELSTAVKPYAFEHLFQTYGFDRIVYLDPDIRMYSPLKRIREALDSANIVLTPHLTGPLEDDKRPTELDILRSGAYNLGFIAIARRNESISFLAWWQQRLYDRCVVDLARGLFVDQRWVDLVPGMFESVAIVRDPGYNVAYWNLTHRIISGTPSGYEVSGDRPLAFFHFSGYDANQPDKLSRHQDRHNVHDLPFGTRQILKSYRHELLQAGYATSRKWPYTFAAFENGTRIPDLCRPIQNEAPEVVTAIANPFSDEGFEKFLAVWNSPVQGFGERPGITRLAYRIYRTRTDVQSAMPDIFGSSYRRFLDWMLHSGRVEHGLGDVFLIPVGAASRSLKDHRENLALDLPDGNDPECGIRLTVLAASIYNARPDLQRSFPDPNGHDRARFLVWLLTYGKREHQLSPHHLASLRERWRSAVSSRSSPSERLRSEFLLRGMSVSAFFRSALRRVPLTFAKLTSVRSRLDDRVQEEPVEMEVAEAQQFGVNLVGYFQSETGVGQSARAAFRSLCAAAVPLSLRSAKEDSPCRQQDSTIGPMSAKWPYATNLFFVNADQTPNVMQTLGEVFYRNRRNIGYWAWELEEFPDRWTGAFSSYDEIWTPSNFCRDAFARKSPIPVFTMPHAIHPVVSAAIGREHFSLSPDRFTFLCAFDVLSVVQRKNPLAVVRAFQRAFGPDSNCQLVIKINNAATAPKSFLKSFESFRAACDSPSVRVIDATFSREEMYALTRCSDCVVSLHRSEGFGLLIAEAMYFEKPVIVTNYSGNTDFTKPANSMLVDYKLTPVGSDCQPYDPNSLWADPDVDHAAAQMRRIAADADLRARLSAAAGDFVRTRLSPEAVGRMMRDRLERIWTAKARPRKSMAAAAGNRNGSLADEIRCG